MRVGECASVQAWWEGGWVRPFSVRSGRSEVEDMHETKKEINYCCLEFFWNFGVKGSAKGGRIRKKGGKPLECGGPFISVLILRKSVG